MRVISIIWSLLFAVSANAADVKQGQALYLSRCAACHGEAAHGNGAMAALLTIPVPDLTQLAARNGGVFPRVEVVRLVDGRLKLRGHGGDGPMPVFGPVLGGGSVVLDGSDGSVVETRGDILSIVLYLESLQGTTE